MVPKQRSHCYHSATKLEYGIGICPRRRIGPLTTRMYTFLLRLHGALTCLRKNGSGPTHYLHHSSLNVRFEAWQVEQDSNDKCFDVGVDPIYSPKQEMENHFAFGFQFSTTSSSCFGRQPHASPKSLERSSMPQI